MKCRIWIHDHEILYEFIIWIQIWIHDYEEYREFICQNSYVWIHLWIHAGEFMIMKSYMNSYVWIHVWIQCYEEYREIMAEFLEMNSHMKSWLNSFSIPDSAQNLFQWEKMFYSSKVITSDSPQLLCSQLTASPKAAAWLLLGGNQAELLRRQTSGAAHSRAGRTWRAL